MIGRIAIPCADLDASAASHDGAFVRDPDGNNVEAVHHTS